MVSQGQNQSTAPPTYGRIHAAARKLIATACTKCGATGRLHAALQPDTPLDRLLTDPRSGCRYSVDPHDYEALCPRCHVRQDQTGPRAGRALRTHCKHGHEFTPENTRYVGRQRARACDTCYRARTAAFNASVRDDPEKYAAHIARVRTWARSPEGKATRKAWKVANSTAGAA